MGLDADLEALLNGKPPLPVAKAAGEQKTLEPVDEHTYERLNNVSTKRKCGSKCGERTRSTQSRWAWIGSYQ